MILHEWIEQHKAFVVNTVRYQRGCDDLADELAGVFNDCYRIINEDTALRRRIKELEAELATFRPAPVVTHREWWDVDSKFTGD
jgi:rRNA-processing protein FCF1